MHTEHFKNKQLIAGNYFSSYLMRMISINQIRAARALLGWKQSDLADKAGVSLPAINNMERGVADPRLSTLKAIAGAFEKAGIIFIHADERQGEGVRFAKD